MILNQEIFFWTKKISCLIQDFFTLHQEIYLCARRFKYMCKNENIHARIKTYIEKNITTQNTNITSRFSYSHQDTKWHQIRQNHTKTKRKHTKMPWSLQDMKQHQIKQNRTKTKNQPRRRKIIPRFSWSHQGVKWHQDKQNHTKTKISTKAEKNHTKIHVTTIKWWRHPWRDHISE